MGDLADPAGWRAAGSNVVVDVAPHRTGRGEILAETGERIGPAGQGDLTFALEGHIGIGGVHRQKIRSGGVDRKAHQIAEAVVVLFVVAHHHQIMIGHLGHEVMHDGVLAEAGSGVPARTVRPHEPEIELAAIAHALVFPGGEGQAPVRQLKGMQGHRLVQKSNLLDVAALPVHHEQLQRALLAALLLGRQEVVARGSEGDGRARRIGARDKGGPDIEHAHIRAIFPLTCLATAVKARTVASVGSELLEGEAHDLASGQIEPVDVCAFATQIALSVEITLVVDIGKHHPLAIEGHVGIKHHAVAERCVDQALVRGQRKQQLFRAVGAQQAQIRARVRGHLRDLSPVASIDRGDAVFRWGRHGDRGSLEHDGGAMNKMVTAFIAGLIFGVGLIVAQMPHLAERFIEPVERAITRPLITGAALFGIGWGLGGFCPGPAVVSDAFGEPKAWVFFLAMLAGMYGFSLLGRRPRNVKDPLAAVD